MDDGLSRLLPLLFVAFIWILGSFSRKKKPTGNGAGRPGAARNPAAEAQRVQTAPARETRTETRQETRAETRSMLSSGMSSAGYGSLGGTSTEGVDPCHDEPSRMPVGSLRTDSAEGRDPCHDDWKPAAPNAPAQAGAPETAGGLNLGWTGNEVVKGFIYGEILNRKIG